MDGDEPIAMPIDPQLIIDHAAHGIMVVDEHHRIITFNRALERITGYPAEEALGVDCSHFLEEILRATPRDATYPCAAACPFLLPARVGDRYSPTQVEITTRIGEKIWVDMTLGPMRAEDGSILGIVHTFTSASLRKEIEMAKEELISLVSHELRTPLTSISGYTQLLIRRVAKASDRQEDLRTLLTIKQQADRLAALIDGLLEVSRIQAGMLRLHRMPLNLSQLVSGAVAALQPLSPRHQIKFAAPERLPLVLADPKRVEQVLVNLLDNAIKYSPDGGPIQVSISVNSSIAIVSVQDHGVGIRNEDIRGLFQRFHRLSASPTGYLSGLGIGLYISRILVEAHGGAIWASSQLGQGSTFSFTLPLAFHRHGSQRGVASGSTC